MADDEFDPEQFTMERLIRQTHSMDRRATATVHNQGHDEEVALTDPEESLASPSDAASPATQQHALADVQMQQQQRSNSNGSSQAASPVAAAGPGSSAQQPTEPPGAYRPQDYADLDVTDNVWEVFKYISAYQPPALALLPLRVRPFIPDFIPALGGTDEFVKVPRPDGQPDFLGLKVLDEPAAVQSDPALLTLQLRALGNEGGGAALQPLGAIPHKDPTRQQRLASFIASIAELRKSRPAGSVTYSRPMPDVEAVMQEWPLELEEALRGAQLPSADLDLGVVAYARLVCSLLDVPVYSDAGLVESLHLLFSALLAFKSNPYFAAMAAGGGSAGASSDCAMSTRSG